MDNQEDKDRGITFRHALQCVEEHFGSNGLERVFSRLKPDVGASIRKPVPHGWYPVEFSRQLYDAIDSEFGKKDPGFLQDAGRFMAQRGVNGFLKYLVRLVSVEKIIDRVSAIWHRYHKTGSIKVGSVTETQGRKEALVEVIDYDAGAAWCKVMIGYIERMVSSTGAENVVVEKKDCTHKGDKVCSWKVSWEE